MAITGEVSPRLNVLDIFRGMTMFLMIVVNTPGSGTEPFPVLTHADWNGFTLADLVFPSFLFAMGSSLVFGLEKYSGLKFFYKTLRRSVTIFLTGFFLNWFVTGSWTAHGIHFSNPANIRILGVLQRLAICYLIAAILLKYSSLKKVIGFSFLILVLYHFILYVFSCSHTLSLADNAVRRLDIWLFNDLNLYHEKGVAFDPEGILSTFPAVVNVMAGFVGVKTIQHYGQNRKCISILILIGVCLLLGSLFWNGFLPINKKLWTSSFVLLTAGLDFILLGILVFIIEVKKITGGRFFIIFGKNPLFIYALSTMSGLFLIIPLANGLIVYDWINITVFQALLPGPFGSLVFTVAFTMLFWLIAFIMDKYKIYVRL